MTKQELINFVEARGYQNEPEINNIQDFLNEIGMRAIFVCSKDEYFVELLDS